MSRFVVTAVSSSASLWLNAIHDQESDYDEGKITLHILEHELTCRGIADLEKKVLFQIEFDAENLQEAKKTWSDIEEVTRDYIGFAVGFTPEIDRVTYRAEDQEEIIENRSEREWICYSPHQTREITSTTINFLKESLRSVQIQNALHYMRLAEDVKRDKKLRMLLFSKTLEAIIGHARRKLGWVLAELGVEESKEDIEQMIINIRNSADTAHSPNDPDVLHSDIDISENTMVEAHQMVVMVVTKAMRYLQDGKDLKKLKISYFDKDK